MDVGCAHNSARKGYSKPAIISSDNVSQINSRIIAPAVKDFFCPIIIVPLPRLIQQSTIVMLSSRVMIESLRIVPLVSHSVAVVAIIV